MNNIKKAFLMVKKIELFCLKYNYWPVAVEKPTNAQEEEANELSYWLKITNYYAIKKEFKYKAVRNKDGILLISILDNLYVKYSSLSNKARPTILHIISNIRDYCETYGEWPVQVHEPKNEKEKASRRYSGWLRLNYKPEDPDFKYKELEMNDGTKVKDILDNLYNKYYIPTKKTSIYAINRVCEIISYCFKNHKKPIDYRNPTNELERHSNALMVWLEKADYTSNFKYQDLMFNENLTVKDVLDFYYLIYWNNSRKTFQDYYQKLREKVKDDVYFLLFECIIKLSEAAYVSFEQYDYYANKIKEIIEKYRLPITFDTIFQDINQTAEKQLQIYFKKYTIYKAMNHPLNYLYRLLYDYYNIAKISMERIRKKENS